MSSYQSRILVVDDQQLMREHMQKLLGREGYLLEFATNGVEALAQVEKFSPDLILLDVRMPEMDGYEVCRHLRANPHTADIPIIMVTAFDDREARLKGIEAGADDFIPKPYDTLELRARVRTITRLNRYQRMNAERTKFQIIAERSANGYLFVNDQDEVVYANHHARLLLHLPDNNPSPYGKFLQLLNGSYQTESKKAWSNWPQYPADHGVRYLVRPESHDKAALWLRVDTLDYVLYGSEMVWFVALQDVTTQMVARHDMWKFQRAIHHKMRTPLIGMYTGIQFLVDFYDQLSTHDVYDLLKTALEHGNRLKNSIEDILRYVDAPTLVQSPDSFLLAELQDVVAQIGQDLNLEPIQWHIDFPIHDQALTLSRQSMELILFELLENAQKFHPHNKPVITIQLSTKNEQTVLLRIADNGTSLSPEHLRQVWSPYYQAEKNFTGEVVGMGLGLPTVASLVWSVGGECRIGNVVNAPGVCVDLVLPIIQYEVDSFNTHIMQPRPE